jgi:hypothetical protein
VRNRQTGQYLLPDGTWTAEIRLAHIFRFDFQARKVCERLDEAEVYYWFGEWDPSEWDFAIESGSSSATRSCLQKEQDGLPRGWIAY